LQEAIIEISLLYIFSKNNSEHLNEPN